MPGARHRHRRAAVGQPRVLGRADGRPYVDEEVAWAIQKHEALRYFADESVGYRYPEAYIDYFGPDYQPPEYIRREAEEARKHRWYMTSRLVTINDIYSFDPAVDGGLRRVRGRDRAELPAARRGARLRRLAGRAHVADDDLAATTSCRGGPAPYAAGMGAAATAAALGRYAIV